MRRSSKILGGALIVLILLAGFIWSAVLRIDRKEELSVSFLDTGAGSATFIVAPSGRTVLIDGGSGAGILRSLAGAMPWWQRSIDVAIAAHPDPAHATGLIDVLQRYSVSQVFVSGAAGSGPVMQSFAHALADAQQIGTLVQTLTRGQVIDLGDGASLEVLFPDRDLSGASATDVCIEMLLLYGNTSFMLSCGNAGIDNYLVRLDGNALHADVLSADSGSATSSPLFAGFVGAQFVAQAGETYVSDGRTVSLQQ